MLKASISTAVQVVAGERVPRWLVAVARLRQGSVKPTVS